MLTTLIIAAIAFLPAPAWTAETSKGCGGVDSKCSVNVTAGYSDCAFEQAQRTAPEFLGGFKRWRSSDG